MITPGFSGDEKTELDAAIEAGYSQIYIQTDKELFLHEKLRPGKDGKPRFIRLPVKSVTGKIPVEIKPEIQFLPDGKIPVTLLYEVKTFFRQVMEMKKTKVEAMIWILWSQERGYFLHIPNQTVSHASASYDWSDLPPNSSIIVDIHSHADFGAYFSGTDNNDDRNTTRFSGVIGHNDKPVPSTAWRFNYRDLKMDIKMEDIFFHPQPDTVEIPAEWLEKVTVASAGPKVYPISQQGQYGMFPTSHTRVGMDGTPRYTGTIGNGTGTGNTNNGPSGKGYRVRSEDQESPKGGNGRPNGSASSNGNSNGTDSNRSDSQKKQFGGPGTTSAGNSGSPLGKRQVIHTSGKHFVAIDGNLIEVDEHGNFLDLEFDMPTHPLGSLADELREDSKGLAGGHISDEVEDRFHKAAQRQAQADILGEAFDDGDPVGGSAMPFSENDLAGIDIPPEFDAICVNHGKDVAVAYAIIERASVELVSASSVLNQSVENLFQLVDDEKKLSLFRQLSELLPAEAKNSLATHGLG